MSSKKKNNKNKKENINITDATETVKNLTSEADAPEEELSSEQEAVAAEVSDTAETAAEESPAETVQVAEAEEENEFQKSIDSFRSADAESPHKKRGNAGKIVKYSVLAFCAVVFVTSIYYLAVNLYGKYQSDKIYNSLKEEYVGNAFDIEGSDDGRNGVINLLAPDALPSYTPTISEIIENGAGQQNTEKPHTAELAKIRATLESLANVNPEIYGWIKIPGTNIDYPVAQSDNNEYYLDHAYTGDYNVNGSIYADFRCEDNVTLNKNTILYGHNITSGSMFHGVENFFDREFFDNTRIYLYTMHGVFIYEAFSIHEAAYDSGYVNTYFETPEEYEAFIKALAADSDIANEDAPLSADSSIITLSTCTNGLWTKRYALHGVLVSAITE